MLSRGFPLRVSTAGFRRRVFRFPGVSVARGFGARTGVESLWAILSRVVSGPRVRGEDCPQPSHTSAFRGRPGPCVFGFPVRFKRGKRWTILRRSVPWFRVRGLDCPLFPHFPLGGAGSGRRPLDYIINFFHIFFSRGRIVVRERSACFQGFFGREASEGSVGPHAVELVRERVDEAVHLDQVVGDVPASVELVAPGSVRPFDVPIELRPPRRPFPP